MKDIENVINTVLFLCKLQKNSHMAKDLTLNQNSKEIFLSEWTWCSSGIFDDLPRHKDGT